MTAAERSMPAAGASPAGSAAATLEIVVVGPLPPPLHGQSAAVGLVVQELQRRGFAYRVVNLAHGARTASEVGRPGVYRLLEYFGILVRYIRAVARGPKTVYLTIAQSRHGFARDCAMIWVAVLLGRRIIAHLHGGNYQHFYRAQPVALRWLVRQTLRRVERLLVLGERLRECFAFDPRLLARTYVVPNGLPDEPPQLECKQLPCSPADGPVRILYLSNLVESKGWIEVLNAARILRERVGDQAFRVDFFGEFYANADDVRVRSASAARRLFTDFVAEHRLEHCVAFHGVVAGAEKREVLRRSHFFVLPTRYNNEGQPIAIIEAMAFGNVVVATDYRAIPDMVLDGVSGWLLPEASPAVIAQRILDTIHNPERYRAMSRAARQLFEQQFTAAAHLERLFSHLVPAAGSPLSRSGR